MGTRQAPSYRVLRALVARAPTTPMHDCPISATKLDCDAETAGTATHTHVAHSLMSDIGRQPAINLGYEPVQSRNFLPQATDNEVFIAAHL